MNDKDLINDLLATVKFNCDLFLNGTIEAATPNVREAFNTTLFEYLRIQDEIFKKLTERGWYQISLVDPAKVHQTEKKFAEKSFS